jgi:hypothetical protein
LLLFNAAAYGEMANAINTKGVNHAINNRREYPKGLQDR